MTMPRRPGFDPGGWESGGFPTLGPHRYRLWVPPGTRLDIKWGIVIRDSVSARGQLAILNAIPTFDLDSSGQIVLQRRA